MPICVQRHTDSVANVVLQRQVQEDLQLSNDPLAISVVIMTCPVLVTACYATVRGCPTGSLGATCGPQRVKLWPLGSYMADAPLITLISATARVYSLPLPPPAAAAYPLPMEQCSTEEEVEGEVRLHGYMVHQWGGSLCGHMVQWGLSVLPRGPWLALGQPRRSQQGMQPLSCVEVGKPCYSELL